jgi:hypothetical protein
MATILADELDMAARRKRNIDRERVDLRGDADWIARVVAQADRLGLSLSAYIRQAVTWQVERDEAEAPAKPHRKK